jgi:hypothetical protein
MPALPVVEGLGRDFTLKKDEAANLRRPRKFPTLNLSPTMRPHDFELELCKFSGHKTAVFKTLRPVADKAQRTAGLKSV